MKNIGLLLCLILSIRTIAQNSNWKYSASDTKGFIENKGQFHLPDEDTILYAHDGLNEDFYFTPNGLVLLFSKHQPRKKSEDEKSWRAERKKQGFNSLADWQEFENKGNRMNAQYDWVKMQWVGSNPNVKIKAKEKNNFQHSYTYFDKTKKRSYAELANSFQQIVYENLYPGIDAVYEYHPQKGLKYSLIVHPNADVSLIKLAYNKTPQLQSSGDIKTNTFFGELIDHKPFTFYAQKKNKIIASKYIVENNTIGFQLENYDPSQTIIIDPWIQTPNFPADWDCVWECEADASGNVYIIGGILPLQLRKFNSLGNLLWTYNTPYDTTSWLGTFATDNAGNSYVTNGSTAAIQKISTAGTLIWDNPNPGGLFASTEFWNIAFNCDQTKLVIAGTGGILPPLPFIYDINTNNGNVTNSVQVTDGQLFPTQEVRSITATSNEKYYFLTHDSIGFIDQSLNVCAGFARPFHVSNGYALGYKNENWRLNNSGIEAISYFNGFVFVNRGNRLDKRDFNTGAIVQSVTIPGGIFNTGFGGNQVENSGIDIDNCGNIYVGSKTGIVKYNQSLVQTATFATTFTVYDVEISTNGDVIAAGCTGNSGSGPRTGSVQSFAAAACANPATVCCNPSICQVPTLCTTDPPFTISPFSPGGTFSSAPGFNPSTGVFSPSVSGPGTFVIRYTVSCGTDSVTVNVVPCNQITACSNPNGSITASGGNGGPYQFQNSIVTTDCSGCPLGVCFPPICNGTQVTSWTTFANGTTATPTSFPVRIIDAANNILLVNSLAQLTPCNTTCPPVTVSVDSIRSASCFGSNNGFASVSASGDVAPYTFSWQPGNLNGATQNNLTATNYTVIASSTNGCTGSATFTITQPAQIVLSTSKTDAACSTNNGNALVTVTNGGTSPFSYTWSNGATTSTIANLAGGNYTVTVRDANQCSATATVNVLTTNGPQVSLVNQTNVSCFGNSTGSINISVSGGTTPYVFTWSNNQSTQNITGLPAGNYALTVVDANNCQSVFNATITQPASALSISITSTDASCGGNDGTAQVTASGGTPSYSYLWSNNTTAANVNNLSTGIISVVVTDANQCTATGSANITAPGGISVSLIAVDASCEGVEDGSIAATVTGAISPIDIIWSNSDTTLNITNLAPNTYSVTITDGNQCVATASATVNASNQLLLFPTINNAVCTGDSTGAIKLLVSGGTQPFDILWNNGSFGDNIDELLPGSYQVSVTDANGCFIDSAFTVGTISQLSLSLSSNSTCLGDSAGSVRVVINGNQPPFVISWSTGDTTTIVNNLSIGNYAVTVTDNSECEVNGSIAISNSSAIVIEDKIIIQPLCDTTFDGVISIILSNDVTFLWSNNETGSSIENLQVGVYSVTISDSSNCAIVDTTQLTAANICEELILDSLIIYDLFTPNGDGKNDLWVIDGLDNFSDNEIEIFNRWGSKVYKRSPYDNSWDGTSDKNELLPSATYYYILKLNDGSGRTFSGPITIVR